MRSPVGQGPKPASTFDMAERAGVDKIRAPRIGHFASARQDDVRIIGARDHYAAKRQGSARNRRKSTNALRRVSRRFNIGRRDQQGCLDRKIGTLCRDMSYQGTTKAVGNQNAAGCGLDSGDQTLNPCIAIWHFPIGLMNPLCAGKRSLEIGLPVTGS